MRLLCLDIGSNTQDILLLDTAQPVENAIQLVLPSPTRLIAQKIAAATIRGDTIVLIGETMGGGSCSSALRKHLEAGLAAYSVPAAAKSFNDNLEKVTAWGVQLVSPDEAARIKTGKVIRMADIALDTLEKALSSLDVKFSYDAVAVAVLDHGAAPIDQSQRLFRFQQLEHLLKENDTLESFIFTPAELPDYFTRMKAVLRSLDDRTPSVLVDTGAAAVMGALLDKMVNGHPNHLIMNLGNSHALAFSLSGHKVLGFFEHHTSQLSLNRLNKLLEELTSGELPPMEVWKEGGHGSLVLARGDNPFLVVTGPRRSIMTSSRLNPYFAAPFGNMMLTGCFGMAQAIAIKFPEWRDEIEKALG